MMNQFYNHIRDAISYGLADRKAILLIGALVVVVSMLRKDDCLRPIYQVFNVTIFFYVGYGSFISWYSLKGSDKHPDIRNYKRIFWEGFKKSTIVAVYSIGLTFFGYHGKLSFADGNILFGIGCVIVFSVIYLIMIGGLFNRYVNRGKILEAFNIPEILRMMSIFDLKSFIKVLIAVIISQVFSVLIIMGFSEGFTLFEIIYSIFAFFLAPFLYFATKRFIGLNVRDLLEKSGIERK